jgi:class 3 adenylate cyclase
VRIVCKDNKSIPTNISVCFSGSVGAIFFRDLRNLKGYENMIAKNESLLLKILPRTIAVQLRDEVMRNKAVCIAQHHDTVSVLFADMVQFTHWSAHLEPRELVSILNGLISTWDEIAMGLGVEKIKTIGDCYMACCGCPEPNKDNASTLIEFASQMIASLREYNAAKGTSIQIRVGIHTGPVVAGVIGLSKILYDIWGPTVATAASLEAKSKPMSVLVSEETYQQAKDAFPFGPQATVTLKNGNQVAVYLYTPPLNSDYSFKHILNNLNNSSSVNLSTSLIT